MGIHVVRQRDLTGVHTENTFSPFDIRPIDHDSSVKAARTQQGRVEHVRTVGRGNENNSFVRFKSVHLDQELIECLLSLVMPSAQAGTTMAADRIDLIDEDYAWRILLTLFEQVADT